MPASDSSRPRRAPLFLCWNMVQVNDIDDFSHELWVGGEFVLNPSTRCGLRSKWRQIRPSTLDTTRAEEAPDEAS